MRCVKTKASIAATRYTPPAIPQTTRGPIDVGQDSRPPPSRCPRHGVVDAHQDGERAAPHRVGSATLHEDLVAHDRSAVPDRRDPGQDAGDRDVGSRGCRTRTLRPSRRASRRRAGSFRSVPSAEPPRGSRARARPRSRRRGTRSQCFAGVERILRQERPLPTLIPALAIPAMLQTMSTVLSGRERKTRPRPSSNVLPVAARQRRRPTGGPCAGIRAIKAADNEEAHRVDPVRERGSGDRQAAHRRPPGRSSRPRSPSSREARSRSRARPP